MLILQPTEALDLQKSKYTRKWRGKDGKWRYDYYDAKGNTTTKNIIDRDPKKLKARIMDAAKVLSSAGKEALGDRSQWQFDALNKRIVTGTGYALQWKANDTSVGGVSVVKLKKSLSLR